MRRHGLVGRWTMGLLLVLATAGLPSLGAAQRVEHYEMAAYGTARAFAATIGEDEVVDLLQQTLDEEGETDKKLTELSETVNQEANDLASSDDKDDEED